MAETPERPATKVALATSGSGSLVKACWTYPAFREAIDCIVTDRQCGAVELAKELGIACVALENLDGSAWSDALLELATQRNVDYILSYSNLKLFKGAILRRYANRIFNSHFSILPAFRGFYHPGESGGGLKARQIFERTVAYGSRVTGNTVHVVDETVDGGQPLIVGVLNVPYDADAAALRHELFRIECTTILQTVAWLAAGRIFETPDKRVRVRDARFEAQGFSPNIDNLEILRLETGGG